MRLVFDTNIYLAGLLKRGLAFDILDRVASPGSDFSLFTSKDIIEEIERQTERFIKKEWVTRAGADIFFQGIFDTVRIVEPKEKIHIIKEDPDDNKILECAVAGQTNLIITMDKDLLRLKHFRNIPIIHPSTFKH